MPGKPHSKPQSTFFGSDEHGGLAIAAALDSILTPSALAPAAV
jgi:hypothetical protein